MSVRRSLVAGTLLLILLASFFVLREKQPPPRGEARFVGSAACRECHSKAYDDWTGSHHGLAMQEATEATVLGDFENATFEQFGFTTRFSRRDGRHWVRAEGPDGAAHDYEIAYTFGVDPLQQYLVRFPGGRLQCFTIAWDTKARRWFSLSPERDVAPDDWLHWTRGAQTWNAMCAECHSTNVRKEYDLASDTYATTWSEIDVSCEACHGAGSNHVAWAARPNSKTPNAGLSEPAREATSRQEVELCARCHSHRVALGDFGADGGGEILDHAVPTLPSENHYFPDGQIRDEVYEWGSFAQSRMFHAGVRCSDCHDPHRATLRAEGNALCARCHTAGWYDTPLHHFHSPLPNGAPNPGASCVACHMPERVYMGIDRRSDHSLRIPRPDLAADSGSPSACAQCHESDAWAAATLAQRLPFPRPTAPSAALASARRGDAQNNTRLASVASDRNVPAAVRASAVALLGRVPDAGAHDAVIAALADADALVRHAALRLARQLPDDERNKHAVRSLSDPVRAIRQEAARLLAGSPGALGAADSTAFREALADYEQTLRYSADTPSGSHALGNLYAALGRGTDAEAAQRRAIAADPLFAPARINLAHLASQAGRHTEAEEQLRAAVRLEPRLFEARYDLGLLLAETGRLDEAAEQLTAAAALSPRFARAHYNLALLERDRGRLDYAQSALQKALALEPANADFLAAAADLQLRRSRARAVPPND